MDPTGDRRVREKVSGGRWGLFAFGLHNEEVTSVRVRCARWKYLGSGDGRKSLVGLLTEACRSGPGGVA